MARLYLIRRTLETFLGPMTIEELHDSYKRMAFGLQDEIAGHCAPWVVLSNMDSLKEHYPEILKIIQDDYFGGWAISEHTAKKIPTEEKTNRVPAQRNGLGLAFMFLAIALSAAALALYLVKNTKLSGKLTGDADLNVDRVSTMFQQGQYETFSGFMKDHSADVVTKAMRSKREFDDWIPYLRAYAFLTGGEVEGLSPKYLRGVSVGEQAPIDCTLGSWKKRWQQNAGTWAPFFSGKKSPSAQWSRLIAWDPYWIRHRVHYGWVKPGSYYEGCLMMANKALSEVSSSNGGSTNGTNSGSLGGSSVQAEQKILQNRFDWMLDVLSSRNRRPALTNDAIATKSGDLLTFLTCVEESSSFDLIKQCYGHYNMSGLDPFWSAVIDRAILLNVLRIAVRIASGNGGKIDPAVLGEMTNGMAKMSRIDQFTRFDYTPELKFLRALSSSNGEMQKAIDIVKQEFPDVVFDN